jgi:hypothetical protein
MTDQASQVDILGPHRVGQGESSELRSCGSFPRRRRTAHIKFYQIPIEPMLQFCDYPLRIPPHPRSPSQDKFGRLSCSSLSVLGS